MAISVLGVAHANVNCTSLERSLAFYRDALGLVPLIHTAAAPQAGAGFGLDGEVAWDAWMMTDAGGMASTAIDLLEWKTPGPVGRPYADPRHLGFSRLRIGVAEPARVARLADTSMTAAPASDAARRVRGAAPHRDDATPQSAAAGGSEAQATAVCRDPDGTLLELVAAPATQLLAVTVGCADLARSLAWYERVLALEVAPGPGLASPPGSVCRRT